MGSSPLSSPLLSIAWLFIHSLWQGAFVWIMYRLARAIIRDPAMRCHLGHAALAVFIAAQCFTFYRLTAGPDATAPIPLDTTFLRLAQSDDANGQLPLPQLTLTARINAWIASYNRYLPLLAIAWGVGLTLQVLRTIGAFYLLQRHLNACREIEADLRARLERLAARLDLSRPVRFLESALVTTPATARWLKPVVLVPVSTVLQMPPQQLEALILHELAHIKRWDYATNVLRTFVSATYFFQLFIRDICRRVTDDAESATDELAAAALGDRKLYAESLIALEERRRAQSLLLGVSGGDLRTRILGLVRPRPLGGSRNRAGVSLSGTLLSGLVGIMLLLQGTAWASREQATLTFVSEHSFSEIVVDRFSHNTHDHAFLEPLRQALREMATPPKRLNAATAHLLADRLLEGADPQFLYAEVCALNGDSNFERVRSIRFGDFGSQPERIALVSELFRLAQETTDRKEAARLTRAMLVLTSLSAIADSDRTAFQYLQRPEFIARLSLSEQDYRTLRLAVAMTNDRLQRMGEVIRADRQNSNGATNEQIERFAAELPRLPAFQLLMCNSMSARFQKRALDVLTRDAALYPPGSLRYVLEHNRVDRGSR